MYAYQAMIPARTWREALCRYSATVAGSPTQFASLQRAAVQSFRNQRLHWHAPDGIQQCMGASTRELAVAPDRFEVVSDDAILVAD